MIEEFVLKEEILDADDFDLSEICKPRTTNSRKSMAPVYTYLIVKDQTDCDHHMSQKELAEKLAASPINIVVDRRTISRMVYSLADSGVGIKALPGKGVWYDGDVWYDKEMF